MAKRKNIFNSKEFYQEKLTDFFNCEEEKIANHLVEVTNKKDFPSLVNFERNCGYGLDCGFIYLVPQNFEMMKEWKRNDKFHSSSLLVHNIPFYFQSTTLKKLIVDFALSQLGFSELFYINEVLD